MNNYAQKFTSLKNFHDAVISLNDQEKLIPSFAQFFHQYDNQCYLGLTLLHKHFDINDDEFVLHRYENNLRKVIIEPTNKINNAIPIIWKIERSYYGTAELVPLEFFDISEMENASELNALSQQISNKFLNLVLDHSERMGTLEAFGLGISPALIFNDLSDQEVILETESTSIDRSLLRQPIKVNEMNHDKTTQTFWTFSRQKHNNTFCVVHCGTHCSMHCGQHD